MAYNSDRLVRKAIELCVSAHDGTADADDVPYAVHPMAVSLRVAHLGSDAVITALLHDICEDTEYVIDDFSRWFPQRILIALDAITHRDGEPYSDYILRVAENRTATLVKLADIQDNSRPGRGFKESLQERYASAELFLRAALITGHVDASEYALEDILDITKPSTANANAPEPLLRVARDIRIFAKNRDWIASKCATKSMYVDCPNIIRAMLLLAVDTIDPDHIAELTTHALAGDISDDALRVADASDTPLGELICTLASYVGGE